jgi:hypothetical protein
MTSPPVVDDVAPTDTDGAGAVQGTRPLEAELVNGGTPRRRSADARTQRGRFADRSAPLQGARRYLAFGWPVSIWAYGLPVLWVLGLYPYVWILPVVSFGLVIVARPSRFRMPTGAVALAGFLVMVGASGIHLKNVEGLVLFGYRWAIMASMWCCLVWFANVPRQRLPTEVVHRWMGLLFVGLIAFGYLVLVAGTFEAPSVLQLVLPAGIGRAGFIDSVSSLRLAEVTNYLGYTLARPSAPMAYANGWGSTVGLTLPFFFSAFVRSSVPRRRRFGHVMLALASVPMVLSFNRGLWMSIVLMLVYWAVRRAVSGDWTGLKVAATVTVVAAVTLVVTPLGALALTKIETATASNESRGALYEDAWGGALESPLTGWGAPTPRENTPPVGTHGLVWWIMYNHGFIALALFLVWMVRTANIALRTRREVEVWSAVVFLIFVLQFGFYGLLPQLPIVGVAAGLVQRDRWERLDGERRTRRPTHRNGPAIAPASPRVQERPAEFRRRELD